MPGSHGPAVDERKQLRWSGQASAKHLTGQTGAPMPVPRAGNCRTLSLWQGPDKVIHKYLESVTIADLMKHGNVGDDYVI